MAYVPAPILVNVQKAKKSPYGRNNKFEQGCQ
jgi:hypothetical protein